MANLISYEIEHENYVCKKNERANGKMNGDEDYEWQ
jgi:hypothetical protein